MVWGLVAVAGISAASNYWAAKSQEKKLKRLWSQEAFDTSIARSRDRIRPLQDAMGVDLAIQNQAVGQGIAGNLNMQGLGSTGLGATLSAGATAGASFRNRTLMAEMDRQAIQEGIALHTQRANALSGTPNPWAAAMGGAAAGAGTYQNYEYGKELAGYRKQYMDMLGNQTLGPTKGIPEWLLPHGRG